MPIVIIVVFVRVVRLIFVFVFILLFLGTFRATLVPVICIPLSLLGATIALQVAGYSINLITLLAMVLAIGLRRALGAGKLAKMAQQAIETVKSHASCTVGGQRGRVRRGAHRWA